MVVAMRMLLPMSMTIVKMVLVILMFFVSMGMFLIVFVLVFHGMLQQEIK